MTRRKLKKTMLTVVAILSAFSTYANCPLPSGLRLENVRNNPSRNNQLVGTDDKDHIWDELSQNTDLKPTVRQPYSNRDRSAFMWDEAQIKTNIIFNGVEISLYDKITGNMDNIGCIYQVGTAADRKITILFPRVFASSVVLDGKIWVTNHASAACAPLDKTTTTGCGFITTHDYTPPTPTDDQPTGPHNTPLEAKTQPLWEQGIDMYKCYFISPRGEYLDEAGQGIENKEYFIEWTLSSGKVEVIKPTGATNVTYTPSHTKFEAKTIQYDLYYDSTTKLWELDDLSGLIRTMWCDRPHLGNIQ